MNFLTSTDVTNVSNRTKPCLLELTPKIVGSVEIKEAEKQLPQGADDITSRQHNREAER